MPGLRHHPVGHSRNAISSILSHERGEAYASTHLRRGVWAFRFFWPSSIQHDGMDVQASLLLTAHGSRMYSLSFVCSLRSTCALIQSSCWFVRVMVSSDIRN